MHRAIEFPTALAFDRTIPTLQEPEGLAEWRANLENWVQPGPVKIPSIRTLLAAVRYRKPLCFAARAARMPERQALDVVVGVGSQIADMVADYRPPEQCVALSYARRFHIEQPGCVKTGDGREMEVLAAGWQGPKDYRVDIRRPYSAIVRTTHRTDGPPIQKWLASRAERVSVGYRHFAHLRTVDAGVLPTLSGVTDDRLIQSAYVTAFDALAAVLRETSEAALALAQPDVPREWVPAYIRKCHWMFTPREAAGLLELADDIESSTQHQPVDLTSAQRAMRSDPVRFFPARVREIPPPTWLAAISVLGHSPEETKQDAMSPASRGALDALVRDILVRQGGDSLLREMVMV